MSPRFAPISGKHAIEQIVFAIQLPEFLEEKILKKVESKALFKERYPSRINHLGIMTGIGSFPPVFGPLSLTPNPHIVGLQFCDRVPDFTRALFIQEGQISAIHKQYERWTTTAPKICDELSILLKMGGQRAKTVTLAYHDKFVSLSESAAADDTAAPALAWEQKAMFNEDCPFLPTNSFEQAKPWHSNHGFFREADGKTMLVNVNLQKQRRQDGTEEISMVTSYTLLDQDLGHAEIQPTFDFLHTYLKDAAQSVLSAAVRKAIGLDEPEEA
jgi:hypothetical protein